MYELYRVWGGHRGWVTSETSAPRFKLCMKLSSQKTAAARRFRNRFCRKRVPKQQEQECALSSPIALKLCGGVQEGLGRTENRQGGRACSGFRRPLISGYSMKLDNTSTTQNPDRTTRKSVESSTLYCVHSNSKTNKPLHVCEHNAPCYFQYIRTLKACKHPPESRSK